MAPPPCPRLGEAVCHLQGSGELARREQSARGSFTRPVNITRDLSFAPFLTHTTD